MNPEQAFLAVNAFLDALWRRTKQPGELGLFLGMIAYVPGEGSLDPSMWWDWLAAIIKVQTGITFPDPRHRYLGPDMMHPLEPEQAYLAMFGFIEEYWERIGRPAELSALLDRMRYTAGVGAADPSLWPDWLASIEKVCAGRAG
jgi:hypothetical protein